MASSLAGFVCASPCVLPPVDLMKLKRTRNEKTKTHAGEKERKSEALISRQAPGLCFYFHPLVRSPPDSFLSVCYLSYQCERAVKTMLCPQDYNIYLAGTEEGHIHKCSCSYNEQYLETYSAHKVGPKPFTL